MAQNGRLLLHRLILRPAFLIPSQPSSSSSFHLPPSLVSTSHLLFLLHILSPISWHFLGETTLFTFCSSFLQLPWGCLYYTLFGIPSLPPSTSYSLFTLFVRYSLFAPASYYQTSIPKHIALHPPRTGSALVPAGADYASFVFDLSHYYIYVNLIYLQEFVYIKHSSYRPTTAIPTPNLPRIPTYETYIRFAPSLHFQLPVERSVVLLLYTP